MPSLIPSFGGIGSSLFSGILSGGSLFSGGLFGNLFGGNWNRIKYCITSSKISYTCLIPNIKFFVYTQVTSFPIPFIGPTLSTINIGYLTLNYLPYILRDVVCVVKAVVFGAVIGEIPSLPLPSIPFPSLPFPSLNFSLPFFPVLLAGNGSKSISVSNENYTKLITQINDYYSDYYTNNYKSLNDMSSIDKIDYLFP